MTRYFLGVDVGATKTHALIADESGEVVGFGDAGSGNHEGVGFDGLAAALQGATNGALRRAGITVDRIAGAGFGLAGYDWPSERADHLRAVATLGLSAPVEAVNDAIIGLLAGAPEGWGLAVVSGTGCNCWGWDREHRRIGQMTGMGWQMGEAAGASELVEEAIRWVARDWSRRGPSTRLTGALAAWAGAKDAEDLLEGMLQGRLHVGDKAARVVFQVAAEGDAVATKVIEWGGQELGNLAVGVIHQLGFESLEFDVVLVGGLYDGGPLLAQTMQRTVWSVAPGARFLRLAIPPAVGGVLLGMEQVGAGGPVVRARLQESTLCIIETFASMSQRDVSYIPVTPPAV